MSSSKSFVAQRALQWRKHLVWLGLLGLAVAQATGNPSPEGAPSPDAHTVARGRPSSPPPVHQRCKGCDGYVVPEDGQCPVDPCHVLESAPSSPPTGENTNSIAHMMQTLNSGTRLPLEPRSSPTEVEVHVEATPGSDDALPTSPEATAEQEAEPRKKGYSTKALVAMGLAGILAGGAVAVPVGYAYGDANNVAIQEKLDLAQTELSNCSGTGMTAREEYGKSSLGGKSAARRAQRLKEAEQRANDPYAYGYGYGVVDPSHPDLYDYYGTDYHEPIPTQEEYDGSGYFGTEYREKMEDIYDAYRFHRFCCGRRR